MDLKDLSARFKKTREDTGKGSTPKPMDFEESYRIRAKMVGVLLRDARLDSGRSLEDCARLLQVAPQEFEAWEFGERVPSLPQLEILAYFLDVPVSHFWGTATFESQRNGHVSAQGEYVALRNRLIGALLRQARENLGQTLDDLSSATGLSAEQIERYELGQDPLPMHELSVLASGVKKNMTYFLESSSHIGELLAQREQWKHFANMPEDLRRFAANPLNAGFIEIALMLSEMPPDKLRRVGTSILDITM